MAEAEKEKKEKKKRRPRRFNGTGSVYKMPGRRAKPWAARIVAGFDEDGKYIYNYTFHEKSIDAANAISDMQKNCNLNPRSEDTVDQVWERFKTVRYPKLSESTKTGYDASYAHWKVLHNKMIAELKTSDLQEIITKRVTCHTRICQRCGRSWWQSSIWPPRMISLSVIMRA